MSDRFAWPPDMRVAPAPPDAPPPGTWPRLQVTVIDPERARVAGAAVQVWLDGRGCIGRSFGTSFMRPDVVDSPDGSDTWLSAAAYTGADGVAMLRFPTGTATHLVARDARGRVAVKRFDRRDSCMTPCAWRDCGSCTEGAPCTYRRGPIDCSWPRRVTLELAEPVQVSGRVLDQDGHPVAGARVMPTPEPDHWHADLTAEPFPHGLLAIDEWSRVAWGPPHEEPVIADRSGRFRMQLAQRGPMVLVIAAPRHLVAEPFVEVGAGPLDLELRTVRAARLIMRVVDADDQPVVGAMVYVDSRAQAALTDSAGRLVFDGVVRGLHTVSVGAGGHAPREVAMFAGEREMLIRLETVPHVRVELSASPALVSSLGDRPLVDVRLVAPGDPAERLRGGERRAVAELAPDGSGRAVLEEVARGEYTVWVSWRGGLVRGPIVRVGDAARAVAHVRLAAEASRSRRVDIEPGANRRDLVVPAEPGR